jgi:hypothetical protein
MFVPQDTRRGGGGHPLACSHAGETLTVSQSTVGSEKLECHKKVRGGSERVRTLQLARFQARPASIFRSLSALMTELAGSSDVLVRIHRATQRLLGPEVIAAVVADVAMSSVCLVPCCVMVSCSAHYRPRRWRRYTPPKQSFPSHNIPPYFLFAAGSALLPVVRISEQYFPFCKAALQLPSSDLSER